MIDTFGDPARIDPRLDSRSISFENPTGARGRGGTTYGGPSYEEPYGTGYTV